MAHHGHDHKNCSCEVGEVHSLYKYVVENFLQRLSQLSDQHANTAEEKQNSNYHNPIRHINTDLVTCLNESSNGSIKRVFKPYDKRLDKEHYVESDADEELIIYIPFTGSMKIKTFTIIGGTDGSSPKKVKLYVHYHSEASGNLCRFDNVLKRIYINRDDIDFENVQNIKPLQEFDLHEDFSGEIEYQTNAAKFVNVTSLTMYIPSNFGAERTRIYYIGLKGEFLGYVKRAPVITSYELKPNPADNKMPETPITKTIQ